MTAQSPPSCRGPLLCQTNPPPNPVCTRKPCLPNQSFADPVLYGRPRPCRTKSESQASTSQLRSARQRLGHYQDKQRQGTRWALPRQPTGANSRHNSAGRQVPRHAQDTHQTKRRHGKRRALPRQPTGASTRHNSARQTDARTSAGHPSDQAVPGQTQGTRQDKRKTLARPSGARAITGHPTKAIARHPPRPAPAKQTHQDKQRQTKQRRGKRKAPHQGNRKTPTGTSSRQTNPSGQATPDQAAQGIQTEIASLNGDRRFQLQRFGTISSGPLKKLRVSCVHERDGKQVPCVRSLCSYARESRAC